MKYKSTRGGVTNVDFNDIVFSNYASDGGLFVPEYIPFISQSTLLSWSSLSYQELCVKILSLYVNDDIRSVLPKLCNLAYKNFDLDDIVPVNKMGSLYIMELFHGPTLAFKDLGLNLLAQLMEYLLNNESYNKLNKNANVIVQTSGDTGPAAAYSILLNTTKCNIFVLFPYKQASKIQSLQLTTLMDKYPNKVKIYATDKSMDEQRLIVKEIFKDDEFMKKYKICAMNSINFVRILGQLCYYVWCYLKIVPKCDGFIDIAIPSGAFGNSLACCFAKKMGIPIRNIIPCTNENDIIYRIFKYGDFSLSSIVDDYYLTLSPAMDIQIPYNIERYIWLTHNYDTDFVVTVMAQFEKFKKYKFNKINIKNNLNSLVTNSYKVSNENIKLTMINFINKYHYTPCPHSSCAIYGALQFINNERNDNDDTPICCVMSAHPSKFPKIINEIMENNINDKKQYIYKNSLYHHFLPNKNDKQQSVKLKHGPNWKQKWINTIKKDVKNMNKPNSKL